MVSPVLLQQSHVSLVSVLIAVTEVCVLLMVLGILSVFVTIFTIGHLSGVVCIIWEENWKRVNVVFPALRTITVHGKVCVTLLVNFACVISLSTVFLKTAVQRGISSPHLVLVKCVPPIL